MRKFAVCAAAVFVSGCMLGPDYERPELDMPNEFRSDAVDTDTESNLAAQQWQDIYQDEVLRDLLQAGLDNNLDLAVARSRIREAEALLRVARSPLYPRVDGGFIAERELESGLTGSGEEADTISLFGLLSWELDLWGRNRRASEAAAAQMRGQQFSLYDQQVSLIGAISGLYFQLQAIEEQIRITEATIESREDTLDIQNLRHGSGVISRLEVTQAEVALAEAERAMPSLKNEEQLLENQLRLLMGLPPGPVDRGAPRLNTEYKEVLPTGLPSELLERRPDIRAVESELEARSAAIGVAKANLFPRIALTGSFGQESADLSNILDSDGKAWIATFDVLQPIFNAGANRAGVYVAEEQYQQALLNYQSTVLLALGEVSDALDKYQRAIDITASTQRLRDASSEYLHLARLRYANGVLGYIDVLDAERQYFDAQLTLIQAQRDQRLAISFLYRALGGGWTPTELSTSIQM